MKKIKVAVIGCGGISGAHIDAYIAHPQAEMYALCDINEERLNAKGKQYGITRLYTDYKKMFAELPELDAVSVCTWNSAHAECAIAALRAGKHVLCEKPMAVTLEECEAMLAAARESGKRLMIGHNQRLAPAQQRTVAVNGALPRRPHHQPPPMGLVCGQVCPAPELVKCVGLGLLGVLRMAGQNGPADGPHCAAVVPQQGVQLVLCHGRRPLS